MKKNRFYFLLVISGILTMQGYAQNVAINEDGSAPHPNAILDVRSFNKGVLIPRMSTADRLAIAPAKGLLVYDTTTSSFWFNTGAAWQNIAAGATTGTSWSLNGNSGAATDFLGTTNFAPFRIRVNNLPSGIIDPLRANAFWGYTAGSSVLTGNNPNPNGIQNTAMGHNALKATTTGGLNTAMGAFSMEFNISGDNNTAMGTHSLGSITSGNSNTSIGTYSMRSDTSGGFNTAVGYNALQGNLTAFHNTAIGNSALHSNNGERNSALGAHSLFANTTGMGNTALGYLALDKNTTGEDNIAIGHLTARSNTTGFWNTIIGASADVRDNMGTVITNATAIGHGAIVNASNKVRIGNSNVTSIEGQVPFTTPSDGRFKYQVQEDVKGLGFILQLRPVTYQFDVQRFDGRLRKSQPDSALTKMNNSLKAAYTEAAAIRRTGFIAQEVEKAAMASGYTFSGLVKPKTEQDYYSLSYESFVVPLVKAIQELNEKVERLEKENAALKAKK